MDNVFELEINYQTDMPKVVCCQIIIIISNKFNQRTNVQYEIIQITITFVFCQSI